VKDAHEQALMRRAATISSTAHRRAMAATRPGWFEYQVEAELVHEFLHAGAQAVAYPSIVAGGPNACVLHYRDNNRELQDGELLLIDAGCEYQGYASDITRTFPVNGRFSGPQKDVYELVLAAQAACIAAVLPGAEFHAYHKVAERVLAQGFIDLGLCHGTLDEVLETGSYKQFYMHRAGHWLGMDVHDAGRYQAQGASLRLAPGMVLTVEPGAYIRRADNVPEAFWDVGVRIEDDLLVTDAGSENLTAATPRTARFSSGTWWRASSKTASPGARIGSPRSSCGRRASTSTCAVADSMASPGPANRRPAAPALTAPPRPTSVPRPRATPGHAHPPRSR